MSNLRMKEVPYTDQSRSFYLYQQTSNVRMRNILPGIGVGNGTPTNQVRMRDSLPRIGVGTLAYLADVACLCSSHVHLTLRKQMFTVYITVCLSNKNIKLRVTVHIIYNKLNKPFLFKNEWLKNY
jgi:hypothetical protein